MWNSTRSLNLSRICNRILFFGIFVFGAFLPKIMNGYVKISPNYSQLEEVIPLMVILYLCCIPALVALFSLDKMLGNIKSGAVFVQDNTKHLRVISWCCFIIAAIFVSGSYYYVIFSAVAIVAIFFGLIVRVVKNVIHEAVIIKEENDFTI